MVYLTLNDRCDACQAAAAAFVCLSNGFKLYMCMHHTRKHKTALEADGATIIIVNDGDKR
jgi:hypothetical protein